MSDTEQPQAKSAFTDKEERVLKIALLCLKSGPPDIDIEKLVKLGGFNTAKTAANTWGVIKKKLLAMAAEDGDGTATPASATKPKATPKKRGKAAVPEPAVNSDGDDDTTASPKKKAKATPKKKKGDVKAEGDEEKAAEGAGGGEETII